MLPSLRKGIIQQSLGLRISLSYSLVLMRTYLIQLLLMSLIFWICALWNASSNAHDAVQIYVRNYLENTAPEQIVYAPDGSIDLNAAKHLLEPLTEGRLIIDRTQETFITSEEDHPPFLFFFGMRLMMTVRIPLNPPSKALILHTSYILFGEFQLFCAMVFVIISVCSIVVLSIIHRGERINEPALRPITEIAETARRLSATNLSERIELHGARSELKELSDVLNDMLDRIEAAYNTQKQFVSDASHELRTPLAVIQGYADMLNRWGKDDPEILDEAIAAIRSEAAGMKELIEQLLFIARHDNQTYQYNKIYFDACELTEELLRETALIAKKYQVTHGELHHAILLGDRASLKQALRIFVDNALKYTPSGGLITLSCRREGRMCRITVADTGIGISEQDLSRIFDRFYRSDPARSHRSDGHGLGLSIARIIVRAHGGRIEVQSKPDHGSRFHILLPL